MHRYKVILIFFVIITSIHGEDYYEILGVSKSAGQDEIRKAFKKLAIIHHPDKNGVRKLLLKSVYAYINAPLSLINTVNNTLTI